MSRDRNVAVLGSSGFIGTFLTRELVRSGARVTAISRSSSLEVAVGEVGGIRELIGDVATLDLNTALADADEIYYLIGRADVSSSVIDPIGDLHSHTDGLLRTLSAVSKMSTAPSLVYVSSAAVYGAQRSLPIKESAPLAPQSPYGVAKLAAEEYVRYFSRAHGVPTAVVRPFSVYGPGQRKLVIYDWIRRMQSASGPLELRGSRETTRDFCFVSDAVTAIIAAMRAASTESPVFNVCRGVEVSLGLLAELISRDIGRDWSMDRFSEESDPSAADRWMGDVSAIERLGVIPRVGLTEGLSITSRWIRNHD